MTSASVDTPARQTRRFIVQFPSSDAYEAAQAVESFAPEEWKPVESEERNFFAIGVIPKLAGDADYEKGLDKHLESIRKSYDCMIVEDFQYDLDSEDDVFDPDEFGAETNGEAGLPEVVQMIGADQAWAEFGRGEGVTIAIVDTGVDGTRPEFPAAKRVGGWAPDGEHPWTDWQGHGSMCAAIAAGTKAEGGEFEGVAPDASLISCRTSFYTSELVASYDYLRDRCRADGLTIVASNSYGRKTGQEPLRPPNDLLIAALEDAIRAGVYFFFSAGNNHERAGGDPADCHPNSIWLHKSREDIMAVATCDLDGQMWFYSSRGPGQYHGDAGMSQKPDVTAPTPRNGRILYGSAPRVLPNGWGTSGACPQVAGLAALILARRPGLGRPDLFQAIRNHSIDLGFSQNCQGAGRIDVLATLRAIP